MNAIEALIQRMDQAPEEFVEDGTWKHTRWAQITDIMIAESKMTPRVFTQEEIDAYMIKMGSIVRKQLEEHICVEILNPLRSDQNAGEQMDLFKFQDYRATVGSGGSGGSVTVDNSALRAMVYEQHRQQQQDLQNHIEIHKGLLKRQREKEREGVMQRIQNTIKALRKQTP